MIGINWHKLQTYLCLGGRQTLELEMVSFGGFTTCWDKPLRFDGEMAIRQAVLWRQHETLSRYPSMHNLRMIPELPFGSHKDQAKVLL